MNRAEAFVWAALMLILSLVIISNAEASNGWWVLPIGAAGAIVGLCFLFVGLIPRR